MELRASGKVEMRGLVGYRSFHGSHSEAKRVCGILGSAGAKRGFEQDWRGFDWSGFCRETCVSTVCTGLARVVEKWGCESTEQIVRSAQRDSLIFSSLESRRFP